MQSTETSTSKSSVTKLVPTHVGTDVGTGQMFDKIATRYDRLNRIMSFGLDRSWRRKLIKGLGDVGDGEILDLATGTGDVALEIAKHNEFARVCGADTSVGMMAIGERKAAERGVSDRVSFCVADAQNLPFDDNRFAGACIAFGIRNVPDRLRALEEMARVTRRGGRVLILELSEPRKGLLAPFARFHIHHVVPRLGAWLSGQREYRYLEKSVAAFPDADEFAALMTEAGLYVGDVESLSFGAAHLYFSRAA